MTVHECDCSAARRGDGRNAEKGARERKMKEEKNDVDANTEAKLRTIDYLVRTLDALSVLVKWFTSTESKLSLRFIMKLYSISSCLSARPFALN